MAALAQTDRGTITGSVADQSGAVVAAAPIEARNVGTGQVYSVLSTETGNYTIAQLPAGSYELTANVQGFKKFVRQGLTLATAQTLRVDLSLEVGSSAESVTVTAEATLLKTESGELAQNVTVSQLNNLPVLGVGPTQASAAGVRNPWALALLVPGAQYSVSQGAGGAGGVPSMVVNGAPANTASYRIEGMDAGNNGTLAVFTMQVQPSAEAIQEVAVQTSNFAAEFGAVGGGLFNATMRSGTNTYHGSLYNYNVNEAYNARQPFTGLLNRARRNNYGVSLGGPVRIPKLYNGTDRSFFFFNWEQFLESQVVFTSVVTVPTPAYRAGDFSGVITGSNNLPLRTAAGVYIDPLGRQFLSGTVFDPGTERAVTCSATVTPAPTCVALGQAGTPVFVRDPFPGNRISPTQFDRVATNVQNLIPLPEGPNATRQVGSNFNRGWKSSRSTEIPSLKLDQAMGKGNLSFYWSGTRTADQYPVVGSPGTPEGFPDVITSTIANFDRSYTLRVNYDHSITPTLLLHLGAGYLNNRLWDASPVTDFNPLRDIGLRGPFAVNRNFPRMTFDVATVATGGMSSMGALFQTQQMLQKPQGNLSLTWVRKNHTIKLGAEGRTEGNPQITWGQPPWSNSGSYTFAGASVNQTALQGVNLTQGTTGFSYAGFLLGRVTTYAVGVPAVYRFGKQQWALFLQDSWKVTRKLTLDYGLRWDYGTYAREQYGRTANFSRETPNPSAGGRLGAIIYEATCKCTFANNYPYAIGPRIGVAYQMLPRTVLRAGIGVVYNQTTVVAGAPLSYQTGGTPGFGQALFALQDGVPSSVQPTWPNFDPGFLPLAGQVGAPPTFLDPSAGRPARQIQWSAGIQREINRNLVAEASYVANRGAWWPAGALSPVNSMSEQLLNHYGFTVGNANDAVLLNTQLGQLTAAQRSQLAQKGVGLPYNGFPSNQTVLQSLLPYPQFTGNINPGAAPLGRTWYDSLQTTVTQRFTRGLSLNGNFTWAKTLDLNNSPDIFNRQLGKNYAGNDLPFQFRLSAQYVSPVLRGGVFQNRILSYIFSEWGMAWYLQYQSAPVLARPAFNGLNPISRWLGRGPGPAERVPGQPLYSTNWVDVDGKQRTDELDINCHCFDPRKTVVLNRNAWAAVPDGQFSSNLSTIRNFRGFRYPTENLNFSRVFRFKERVTLNIRGEFSNVFNRVRLPQPSVLNPAANPVISPQTGLYTAGYGTVVPVAVTQQRGGMIVARLMF
jgi:hypothetical protein